MYNCFISLGYGCGITASLSKEGLRSFAGPFDWCIQELKAEMKVLLENFEGFLLRENIRIVPDKVPTFKDLSNGIIFPDEHFKDLDKEWDEINEKYQRRIKRAKEKIEMGGVCFIRGIVDQAEVDYILHNAEEINSAIRSEELNNDIIFLAPNYVNIPDNFGFRYYIMPFSRYTTDFRKSLRGYYDLADGFVQYCVENYNENERNKNLVYDLRQDNEYYRKRFSINEMEARAMKLVDDVWEAARRTQRAEAKFNMLVQVVSMDLNEIKLPDRVIIYGAGDIGKVLYNKLREKIEVEYFIDKFSNEGEYLGCPIISIDQVDDLSKKTIVVTTAFDFEDIKFSLKRFGQEVSVIHVNYIV